MNILTFDIEEWALVKSEGQIARNKYAEYDRYLERILEMLNRRSIYATFFCTGMMAQKFPHILKLIYNYGHEIGCHSFCHTWLNKMNVAEVREDTHAAVDAIEQCVGQKVLSYRAPAFSIGENNKWAFDILAENGIERDASVFPANRDFGGFPRFEYKVPVKIQYEDIQIKEYPICTIHLLGKDVAYSGGGYFRFFPLWFVKNEIRKADYAMTYFHIGDLMPETNKVLSKKEYESYFKEPGTISARYKRYLKTNIGKRAAMGKLLNLIESFDFISLKQADELINWEASPIVNL